ncbi:MAG TPA: cytochrome c oxidase subunit I [Longimicrobiales bacterium]
MSTAPVIRPRDEEKAERFRKVWDSPRGIDGIIREINNIPVAHRYMASAFSFFLAAGLLALVMRTQLARPGSAVVDPETYNQLFTMHGTTMMFLFVIPFTEAVATYMLPLMLGTRDLPFPRLTALSLWTFIFGGLFIFSSFLFGAAPNGGWFAYVPLTNIEYSPGINMDFWDIGLSVAEIAAMGAAAEIMISVLRMRAPGMALHRIPMFAWAMLIVAVMIVFAFTPLIVGTLMLELDRKGLTAFFKPEAGGEPLLWQHLFWVFGHPEVYIMFIPAVGIVTHVVQAFARRPIVSYTLVVLALLATGFISFGLWVHHMFTTGLSPVAMGLFVAASFLIAIPNGIQVFSWIATLWTGRPVWRTPLLFVVGFIIIFVAGGLTGVMVGAMPFDAQVHDTYFVVAHFHYVLIGGVVFPLFAGLYYWLPKITGRLLDERLGKWNFWLMFISFNVAFFPMHVSGLLGMPRRVYTYPEELGVGSLNMVSTIGAYGFALGVALFLVNVVVSFWRGRPAGANPWDADTLEWSETSPPPNAQFERIPVVRSRHPMWEQDSLGPVDARTRKLLEPLDTAPTGWRGALVVSVLDGRPLALVHVPSPTIWPFVMSIGFVVLLAGALLDSLITLGVGAAITAVSTVGWFWPAKTERLAIEEIGTAAEADRLPLAVAGPLANGAWGTAVLIVVLLTALVTFITSYFYLGNGPFGWPPTAPDLRLPAIATVLAAAVAGAGFGLLRAARRVERKGARRLWTAAAMLLSATFTALSMVAYLGMSVSPSSSAYASALVGLLGFQWSVMVMVFVMMGVGAAWAWAAPRDPRGHGVAFNAALVALFSAASWAAVFVTLYVTPRLW